MEVSINYKSQPISALDEKLIKLFKDNGFRFLGSGYDFTAGIRDLAFEQKAKPVEDK